MIANVYSVMVSRKERESAPAYGPLPTPASSRSPSPILHAPCLGACAHPLPIYTRREPNNAKERTILLLDLREDLRVAEGEVLLRVCEGHVSDQRDVTRMPTDAN